MNEQNKLFGTCKYFFECQMFLKVNENMDSVQISCNKYLKKNEVKKIRK